MCFNNNNNCKLQHLKWLGNLNKYITKTDLTKDC
jgi:hypothetical protein